MNGKKNRCIIGLCCLLIAICNTFCNKKSDVFRRLEGVERLFTENKDSVAAQALAEIDMPTDSSADLALYNYLQAKKDIRAHTTLASNCLDFSISFFEQTNDSLRLAYAYNYKSSFLLNENNKKDAHIYNVAAERIADCLNNHILNYNIYSIGYYIAAYSYDTDESIYYATKAYMTGRKLDDARRMAYSAVFLTMCYNEKGIPDSTKRYMAVCLNYLNDYDDLTKSIVCQVLGDVLSKSDDLMAEHYYKESLSIRTNEDAYKGLTRLYLKQNKMSQSDTCFQKALRPKAYETNIELMSVYANKLQSVGDMAKAVEILNLISATKDSLYIETKDGLNTRINILTDDIQRAKDVIQFLDYKIFIYQILLIFFVLCTVTLSILVYRHRRLMSETTENDAKYEQYETQIVEDTETDKKEKDFENGKQLYEMMVNECKSIFNLNKEQRMSIVKYYESIDSEYINILKETYEYEKVSVSYIIVLILQHIGKDKNAIIEIMGFTDQAMRSLKSRCEKYRL